MSLDFYLKGFSNKSRIMLYLIGKCGLDIDAVRQLDSEGAEQYLSGLYAEYPELAEALEKLISAASRCSERKVFVRDKYRHGYSEKDIQAILVKAHRAAELPYTGIKGFQQALLAE